MVTQMPTEFLRFVCLLGLFVCLFFETVSHYVAYAGLELMILLPQLPEGWDYRHMPPYQASFLPFNSQESPEY
jgi:hypothetical protein